MAFAIPYINLNVMKVSVLISINGGDNKCKNALNMRVLRRPKFGMTIFDIRLPTKAPAVNKLFTSP